MPLFEQKRLNLPKTLSDKYIVPPFSVFNTHQPYWRDRMRMWRDMGLYTTNGREEGLAYDNRRMQNTDKHISGTSSFSPVLCEIVYKWFASPNSVVLDPFAGGIVRGGVAAMLGHTYIGLDINPDQVNSNEKLINELEHRYNFDGTATYVCQDSTELQADLIKGCDIAFTCPPYYNLEIYTDDKNDLSNCESYHQFINKYRNVLVNVYNYLKENSFFVVVVSDIRDKKTGEYYGFVADTIKQCQYIGFKFYNEIILYNDTGNLAITSGNYLDKARKVGRQHQNILVFYKGEPRNIKEKFGAVNN